MRGEFAINGLGNRDLRRLLHGAETDPATAGPMRVEEWAMGED